MRARHYGNAFCMVGLASRYRLERAIGLTPSFSLSSKRNGLVRIVGDKRTLDACQYLLHFLIRIRRTTIRANSAIISGVIVPIGVRIGGNSP